MRRGAIMAVLGAAALAPAAGAAPYTTVQRTIVDCTGDNLLEVAGGEEHVSWDDGGSLLTWLTQPPAPPPDPCSTEPSEEETPRLPRGASILNFLQLSDFQIVDEESPGRVEFLDGSQRIPGLQPFSAAYRPQESLTTQVTEAMVRQVKNTVSPVTGQPLELTILTGDNADSQQYNETRWFIDILDGTDTGENPDPEMSPGPGADRKIDPDSGIPTPACEATPGSVYDGVRGGGRSGLPDDGYYEPDSSSGQDDDGDGYSPFRRKNVAETPGRDVTVRDFPGLLERANAPFEAVGLDMPWYSAFGNHDALLQGNSPEGYFGPFGPQPEAFDPAFHAIATGCVKVMQPGTAVDGELSAGAATLQELRDGGVTAAEQDEIDRLTARLVGVAARAALDPCDPARDDGCALEVVPPDPRRCYLAKDLPAVGPPDGPCAKTSWIAEHFRTTGTPVGHGFASAPEPDLACAADDPTECPAASYGRPPSAILNHDGYYSFSPKPGLRFVVLDTVTDECGTLFCAEGSVDHLQFQWLAQQILAAHEQDQYVVVFSHHTLRTTRFPSADPSEQPVHYGQRVDRDNPANPQNPSSPMSLEELFCTSKAVLAHVAGHEHENYVQRYDCPVGLNPHFWEISTAAHIDWPQQARMIELIERGGKVELVLTMLDHAGPANPGGHPLQSDQGRAGDEVPRLASIARELTYNDYQASRAARGERRERNVILPTGRPWPVDLGPPTSIEPAP